MRCIARVAGCVVLALLTAGPTAAAPYWVAWEGNDYPENEGWTREGEGTFPTRSLGGGVMTLDSLASEESKDIYGMLGRPDPEDGEEFVVQWRLRVNEVDWDNPNFRYDPGWSVRSSDGWQATFALGVDELMNAEEQVDVPFAPGVFHTWEFRSRDMRAFAIKLDGVLVTEGNFIRTLPGARVHWGDFVGGPTSSVDWDYFRFGVVPEPRTFVTLFVFAFRLRR